MKYGLVFSILLTGGCLIGGLPYSFREQKTLIQDTCIDSARINPSAMCIQNYNPVCGCDNKTYSNSCMAEKAGVLRWIKGECPEKKK